VFRRNFSGFDGKPHRPGADPQECRGFGQVHPTFRLPIPSDSVHYSLTFTAPGQSVGATIQIMSPIPEPVSLALIGSGLFTVGLLARRRRKTL
jgi:hypothetical protein